MRPTEGLLKQTLELPTKTRGLSALILLNLQPASLGRRFRRLNGYPLREAASKATILVVALLTSLPASQKTNKRVLKTTRSFGGGGVAIKQRICAISTVILVVLLAVFFGQILESNWNCA